MLCYIPEFPDYAAHLDGSIWSCKTGVWKQLSPRWTGKNRDRASYTLSDNGLHYQTTGANLILITFVGPCPENMEACHNDGDCSNDAEYNLRWDTHVNNCADKIKHGTAQKGVDNPNAKYDDETIKQVRLLLLKGEKQIDIANKLNISASYVSNIHNNRWRTAC